MSDEFRQLLQRSLSELPPAGPLRREVTRILDGQPFHWERVCDWPDLYRNLRSDLALLLEELHEDAADLPRYRWENTRLRRFMRCRASARALDSIQTEIETAWDNYMSRPIGSREVTAESVAGHRLLVEGLGAWMEALALARQSPDDEAAVDKAIEGNRLLATLHDFSKHLAGQIRR